jgi:hypothetical protein
MTANLWDMLVPVLHMNLLPLSTVAEPEASSLQLSTVCFLLMTLCKRKCFTGKLLLTSQTYFKKLFLNISSNLTIVQF